MNTSRSLLVLSLFASLQVPAAALAAGVTDPLKVPRGSVLVTTTIDAGGSLSATLTEYFTGERKEKTAINLLLGLYRVDGQDRILLASRDYNAEAGGEASRGSLEIVDLDRDGTNEILVNYHHQERVGTTRIDLDVLRLRTGRLVLAWSGPLRVDTSNPEAKLPAAERERFTREIGYLRTAAAAGSKIYFKKTVAVAAGVAFDPPRVVDEEFDLAGLPASGGGNASAPR